MIHIWVLHSFLSNIDIIIFFWGCSYLDDIVMIQTWSFHLPERPTVIPDGTVLLCSLRVIIMILILFGTLMILIMITMRIMMQVVRRRRRAGLQQQLSTVAVTMQCQQLTVKTVNSQEAAGQMKKSRLGGADGQ